MRQEKVSVDLGAIAPQTQFEIDLEAVASQVQSRLLATRQCLNRDLTDEEISRVVTRAIKLLGFVERGEVVVAIVPPKEASCS